MIQKKAKDLEDSEGCLSLSSKTEPPDKSHPASALGSLCLGWEWPVDKPGGGGSVNFRKSHADVCQCIWRVERSIGLLPLDLPMAKNH